jgi:hypothetical protein
MIPPILLASFFSFSLQLSPLSDTLPKGKEPAFTTEGERQAYELQQFFRDYYTPQTYLLFDGPIAWIAPGTYQYGLLTMRMDSLLPEMAGLLSRGLLYPGLLGSLFGPTDTLSIGHIVALPSLPSSPPQRRFSCLMTNQGMVNPILYVFELTNPHGTADMAMPLFIRDARLTFLHLVSILI